MHNSNFSVLSMTELDNQSVHHSFCVLISVKLVCASLIISHTYTHYEFHESRKPMNHIQGFSENGPHLTIEITCS